MRISFFLSHPSHQIATFLLAKKLVDNGHFVIFCGTLLGPENEDMAKHVVLNGFTYHEVNFNKALNSDSTAEIDISIQDRFNNFIDHIIDPTIFNKSNIVLLDISSLLAKSSG